VKESRGSTGKAGKTRAYLADMSFDALLDLRLRLDRLIAERVRQEERELEVKLANLKKLRVADVRAIGAQVRHEPRKGRKLPAKYRNPKNKMQTWAGRGLRPRWLEDGLKSGLKLEDFAI